MGRNSGETVPSMRGSTSMGVSMGRGSTPGVMVPTSKGIG
jgi:hypothetical protein